MKKEEEYLNSMFMKYLVNARYFFVNMFNKKYEKMSDVLLMVFKCDDKCFSKENFRIMMQVSIEGGHKYETRTNQ